AAILSLAALALNNTYFRLITRLSVFNASSHIADAEDRYLFYRHIYSLIPVKCRTEGLGGISELKRMMEQKRLTLWSAKPLPETAIQAC
ncbi:hypothetical protein, partial [Lonsdalea britannica]|uniref:hypothetical protein n=1 Tax=Lonsdalea britannica TaxID=1082704 RepID=UPI001C38A75D